jgi:uncharacterized protein
VNPISDLKSENMKTLLIAVGGLMILSLPVKGQFGTVQAKDNTLLVKGTAILKQMPEIIYASVNVKAESQNYADCQNKLMAKMERTRASLLKHEISSDLIKTNGITINEKQEYIGGRMTKTGYAGTISLTVESQYSPELAKKLLAAFTSDSLVLNYSIAFRLSEKQKSLLRQLAITQAVDDAKEKASVIAASSRIKLVRLNSITYLDDETAFVRENDIVREEIRTAPEAFVTIRGNEPDSPNIDFNPKEIGIVKSVRIEWTIEESQAEAPRKI